MATFVDRLRTLSPGTLIPKPEGGDFTIKGWGRRDGQPALVYYISNHRNVGKLHQKGATVPEWEQAHARLLATGELTKRWFDANMLRCASEGACNFTTIGGLFCLLGEAAYESPGVYRRATLAKSVQQRPSEVIVSG